MTMESAREAQGEGRAGRPHRLPTTDAKPAQGRPHGRGLRRGDGARTVAGGLQGRGTAARPVAAAGAAVQGWQGDWLFRSVPLHPAAGLGEGRATDRLASASMQQEALGLSPSQTKAINRALIEAGALTMKDSPNGKRYGVRDRAGRITEAYGFDLAPIATRHIEFVRLAEEARAERAEMGRLRRRATVARKGIVQILETATEYGLQGEDWAGLG
jgi:hypothetical protein